MSKLTVNLLSDVVVPLVTKKLGPLAGKLMERVLRSGGDAPVPTDANGAVTPPLLKKLIQELISAALAVAPLPPSLKAVLDQLVVRLDGVLMDMIWNALFGKGLVPAPTPAAVPGDVEPLAIPAEANGAYFAEFGEAIPGSGY